MESDSISNANDLDPIDPSFVDTIRTLLRVQTLDPLKVTQLVNLYENYPPAPPTPPTETPTRASALPQNRGALAFLLFTIAASNSTTRVKVLGLKSPDDYLEDEQCLSFLSVEYDFENPAFRKSSVTWLKTGTSSFILRWDTRVLKIIKPYFFDFPSIAKATAAYRTSYNKLAGIGPVIHDSKPRYVDMDYIEGATLGDYMESYLHRGAKRELSVVDRLDSVNVIIGHLCSALKQCAQKGKSHLDLSPDNIIVQHYSDGDKNVVRGVKLIDFGYNYLLSERVGTAGALARAQSYIAPELMQDVSSGNVRSDVYSLGKIVLEMLMAKPLEIMELSRDIDSAWIDYPEFAALVEDMIDNDPENRLLGVPASPETFDTIASRVQTELSLLKRVQEESSHVDTVIEAWSTPIGPLASLWRLTKRWTELKRLKLSELRPSDLRMKRLIHFAYINEGLHLITLCAFATFVLKWPAVRLCDVFGGCLAPISAPSLPVFNGAVFGTINGYAPGRLVALLFSYVLVKYYQEIFSELSLSEVRLAGFTPLCRLAEVLLRGTAIVPTIPILYAMIFDPKAWAFCSGTGLIWIGSNNFLMYRVAAKARFEGDRKFDLPASVFMDTRLREFSQWHVMIFWYGVAVFLVGILLLKGVIVDEWFYAIVVSIFVNILKMYRQNCSTDAPGIRALLASAVCRIRRLQLKIGGRDTIAGGTPVKARAANAGA